MRALVCLSQRQRVSHCQCCFAGTAPLQPELQRLVTTLGELDQRVAGECCLHRVSKAAPQRVC